MFRATGPADGTAPLRHHSAAFTVDTCAHMGAGLQAQAAARFGEVLGG